MYPQITGDPITPGEVITNRSLTQSPEDKKRYLIWIFPDSRFFWIFLPIAPPLVVGGEVVAAVPCTGVFMSKVYHINEFLFYI